MGKGFVLAGFCCITDDLLKRRQITQITFAATGRDAADGEGTILVVALRDLDEPADGK